MLTDFNVDKSSIFTFNIKNLEAGLSDEILG